MIVQKSNKLSKQELVSALDILITGVKPFLNIPTLRHSKLKSLTSSKNNFLYIKIESKLAGFLMYRIEKHLVFLYEIHVAKEHQNKGIGSSLIKELFKSVEGKTIILYVHKKNLTALGFYKKHDFVIERNYESDNYYEMSKQN